MLSEFLYCIGFFLDQHLDVQQYLCILIFRRSFHNIYLCLLLQQNEVTDSAYLGSESTYSECETFTDEDTGALVPPEMHEDVETDSGIEATLHDPEDGGTRSVLLKKACVHVIFHNKA